MPEAEKLKKQILDLVTRYYQQTHQIKQNAEFRPGIDLVTCTGKVFDEKEMSYLIESGLEFWLTSGDYTAKFEQKLAEYIGVKESVFVNSGSSANLLALTALTSPLLQNRQIKQGDEVITVAAGFPTTINPIFQISAVPVFVDIQIKNGSYNVDPKELEKALSPKTKAVFLAHALGNPAELSVIKDFCKSHKLFFIEDNCDALGSTFQGKRTGSFGDLSTNSFYPAHHMTTGEGGAVNSDDPFLMKLVTSFRDWGRDCWCPTGVDNTCRKRFDWQLGDLPEGYDHKYTYTHLGYNLKATEMQAAIGLAQVEKLDGFLKQRQKNFDLANTALKSLENYFYLPEVNENTRPNWFGFPLTLRPGLSFKRKDLVNYLESKRIQTRTLFAGNYLRHPAMRNLESGKYRVIGKLENSDYVLENSFWFGIHHGLNAEKISYTIDSINQFIKRT